MNKCKYEIIEAEFYSDAKGAWDIDAETGYRDVRVCLPIGYECNIGNPEDCITYHNLEIARLIAGKTLIKHETNK